MGEDPKYYFCHKDFKRHLCQYNYDNIFKNDFKNKNESFDCTSYSMWIDQMLNYAGVRKAASDYGGNSLDNIAHIELGAEKRRYSKNTVTVLNGAVEEYWNFVKYSINDVLLQYGIDEKTTDLDTLFDQSIYGGTRFSKTLKQSVYLKNFWAIKYFEMDIVPGNNLNVNYVDNRSSEIAADIELYNSIREERGEEETDDGNYDEMSLPGAVVGDPTLNAREGIMLFGQKSSHMFKLVCDFDYSSMYPNGKITANIAPHTQYGRLIIPNKVLENENPDNNPKFMRAGKYIEDIETGDASKIGMWHNLPSKTEIYKLWEAKRTKKPGEDLEIRNGYVKIAASSIIRGGKAA